MKRFHPGPPLLTRRQTLGGLSATGAVLGLGGALFPARAQAQETALRVLEWGGYELPHLYQDYLDAGHAMPAFTFMSSDLETINQLRAGIFADIVNPTNNYVPVYLDSDLVEPWDLSLIPRYADIIPAFKDIGMRDGKQYYIPVTWGYESVIYNADEVDPGEESYALLFDDRYAGKIAWWDNSVTLVLAALVLGIENVWDMSEAELDEVTAFLSEKKKNVRFLWSFMTDFEPEFLAKSLVISYGFTSSWLQAREAGINARYMAPKEGRIVWMDGYMQLKGTPASALNHAFVDAWLNPATGLWIVENYGYSHSSTKIDMSKLDPFLVADLNLSDPSILSTDKVRFRQYISNVQAYARAWDRVKAA